MHRRPTFFVAFALLAVAVLLALSLASGSVPLTAAELLAAFTSDSPSLARDVVLELRLPRALAAFAVGGLLALAGAMLQVLLRNPLADPYVLGVSGGASVAALIAIMLGLPAAGVDGLAALGALAACLLVFALAQGPGGWTPTRLLLTGIVVAAGAGSVVSLLLALGDETRLRGMVFWLLGDLSGTRRWAWLLGLLAVCLFFSLATSYFLTPLNLFQITRQMALLTVIAVLHYKEGKLPHYRAELYEKCIEQLMAQRRPRRASWKPAKSRSNTRRCRPDRSSTGTITRSSTCCATWRFMPTSAPRTRCS